MNNETIKLETDEKGVEVLLESLCLHFYKLESAADDLEGSKESFEKMATIKKFITSITN